MVIITDNSGLIISLDPAAATFLNVSPRTGGNLLMFFVDGRYEMMRALSSAMTEGSVRHLAVIRPRDCRAVPVDVTVTSAADGVRWEISRLADS